MVGRKFISARFLVLTAVMLAALGCAKDEPIPLPVTHEVKVLDAGGTSYVHFPKAASYDEAIKAEGLTLSTSIQVNDPIIYIKARWYHVSTEYGDKLMETQRLEPSETPGTKYTSTFTLSEEYFKKYFPENTLREAQFYCTFTVAGDIDIYKETTFVSDTMTIAEAFPAEIMVLRINTVNKEEPTCEYVSPPPGNNGAGIKNCTKVPGRLTASLGGKLLYDSGNYVADQSGMTIKIRGNTSAYGAQKPYKIRLQKKQDLLFRGDEEKYEDKEWILIKEYGKLNTLIALETARYLGFSWVPAMRYVNVVVNDDYRGLYLLIESFKRNEDCRVDITEDGFLIEQDAYWWNEPLHFETGVFKSNMNFTFKYPSPDGIDALHLTYIQQYVQKAEQSIKDGTYEKYIDVPSYARWLLFHDIFATLDCAGSNIFMAKKDMTSNTKLEMLSPWDFDSMYYNGTMQQVVSNQHIFGALYFSTLLRSSNKAFVNEYKSQWQNIRGSLADYLYKDIDSFLDEYGEAINESRLLNAARWGNKSSVGVRINFNSMNSWLEDRVGFLDDLMSKL